MESLLAPIEEVSADIALCAAVAVILWIIQY